MKRFTPGQTRKLRHCMEQLPLPLGEGWGEGPRTWQLSGRSQEACPAGSHLCPAQEPRTPKRLGVSAVPGKRQHLRCLGLCQTKRRPHLLLATFAFFAPLRETASPASCSRERVQAGEVSIRFGGGVGFSNAKAQRTPRTQRQDELVSRLGRHGRLPSPAWPGIALPEAPPRRPRFRGNKSATRCVASVSRRGRGNSIRSAAFSAPWAAACVRPSIDRPTQSPMPRTRTRCGSASATSGTCRCSCRR
jgi:hypothetical protein